MKAAMTIPLPHQLFIDGVAATGEGAIFADVNPGTEEVVAEIAGASAAQEEIFGPVVSVIGYRDVDHAVEMANDSIYGLSGYVFGRDVQQAIMGASVAWKAYGSTSRSKS